MTRVSDRDYQRLADFRYAIRAFLQFSSQAARRLGLTPPQHQALLAIKGLAIEGDATVGRIAERLISQHHSVVELLDRLCELGLVRRHVDARDRRRVQIDLTAKAERLLQRLSAAHIDELGRMRGSLEALLQLSSRTGSATRQLKVR